MLIIFFSINTSEDLWIIHPDDLNIKGREKVNDPALIMVNQLVQRVNSGPPVNRAQRFKIFMFKDSNIMALAGGDQLLNLFRTDQRYITENHHPVFRGAKLNAECIPDNGPNPGLTSFTISISRKLYSSGVLVMIITFCT